MKKIAVITRTKNRCLLLKRAIKSVLGQSYKEWVHVIVNDGGDSAEVDALLNEYMDEYYGRLIVIHNSVSLGMEAASNVGIKASSSDYIVIHDDDDSWDKDFLSVTAGFLNKNTIETVKGVVTHARSITETIIGKNIKYNGSHSFDPFLNSVTLPALSEVNKFMPISFLYERQVLNDIGYYDESLPVIGDWEFNLRFLSKYDIKVITKELANYHIREAASSASYENTVTAGRDLHEFYRSLVINKHVRKEMKNESNGLGFLLMMGDYAYTTKSGIWRINYIIDKLTKNKLIRGIIRWIRR